MIIIIKAGLFINGKLMTRLSKNIYANNLYLPQYFNNQII